MITKTAAVLLFFGATVASGQFMPRLLRPTVYLRSNGCPSGPELAPVICQFMQPSLGFIKPPLIAPSTYIPPLVVEKCDKPQLEIQLPVQEHIVIPEAPILPPITIPKLPIPVITEPIPPMPIVESYKPASIAVSSGVNIAVAAALPPLESPALPEFVGIHGAAISGAVVHEIDYQGMIGIGQAAAFPKPPMIAAPHPEDFPIPEYVPLAPIPAAPVLPPSPLPQIPTYVDIPKPIAPPMIMENPCITDDVLVPAPMPIAPPPLMAPPMILEEPCITDVLVPAPMPIAPPMMPLPVYMPIPMPPRPISAPVVLEEPCITDVVPAPLPAPARLPVPMPILPIPASAIVPDPCEPASEPVMKVAGRLPYVRTWPGAGLAPGPEMLPTRGLLLNKNMVIPSFPYVHLF